jgi:shikimate dehydrogenase
MTGRAVANTQDFKHMSEFSSRSHRVALIGAGIQRSASPSMHMEEAKALGFTYKYELLDLDQLGNDATVLPKLLDDCEAQGYTGLNITYPCKQAVIPLLTELSPEARALHAVNTVVFRDGKRIGYNTDCWGFAESFRRGLPDVSRRRVVLVGAGGAGAAVGYAALELGVQHLEIHDIDAAKAETLAKRLAALHSSARVEATTQLAEALAQCDGMIHATPTGMAKLPGLPIPADSLRPSMWVAEVVYVPLVTELLALARAKGCRTLDGGGMAVFQAVKAFELFTGIMPDAERMLDRFNRATRNSSED